MSVGVVIDTSFLITMAGKERPHHEAARRYWKYFIENEIPIFLSTIVVAEFHLKQEIPPEILRCCVILPFNYDHALLTASLDGLRMRPDGTERTAVKDDVKIIAQAAKSDAAYLITDDSRTLARYCDTFKHAGQITFVTITLEGGFDSAFFANGQRDFLDNLTREEER